MKKRRKNIYNVEPNQDEKITNDRKEKRWDKMKRRDEKRRD